ncbi:MJ0042 family finger-like domain-containing protein [Nitrosomonas cryotolerans]|uniref:MJ0042 family finger-like domain-containing protein n=1 Tax=Nitrosomonas cryotolerans ATCC 49181 TaxID=1131553 RepID=A0A1N6IB81_9PROT|nr:zinc-ribbon and DUF3426 domain-containing protein [Nitrosomonas cryotolerans]SFP61554.1 MJ0042 family finger-like domain-containing protein [Nitrosomonas cryotolerans]SIO29287.1 MJ0042 family finger-like domain-containing protein [Nitrosomonas cryotolerans ATCC 49181]
MALVTLCPNCSTAFRVSAMQLQMHNGDVCCGQCRQIFNGFATLMTVSESEIASSSEMTATARSVNAPESVPEESRPTSGVNSNAELSLASYLIPDKKAQADAEEIETSDEVDYFDAPPPRKQQRAWGIAGLFLLLVLAGQAVVYAYRVELSVITPGIRPYLEQYCAVFSCTVPLPQDLTLLSIEASELRIDSAQRPEVVTLDATIRNHALFPQALPAFKLTLTDIRGKQLASRVFTAEDYLRRKTDPIQSIQPNQEMDIRLYFKSRDLDATGYQLALLYP